VKNLKRKSLAVVEGAKLRKENKAHLMKR